MDRGDGRAGGRAGHGGLHDPARLAHRLGSSLAHARGRPGSARWTPSATLGVHLAAHGLAAELSFDAS